MNHDKHSLARRLKLQQLLIFEKVVEMGSILGASNELHMSQPAVSKSIQELESQFLQPLFVRSKRGVKLTEFGQLLGRHAQTMLAEVRLLADDVNAWRSGISGSVIVGTLIAASAQLLPKAIVRMRELAPNVVLQVRVGSNDALFPELARGQLDLVVGLLPTTPTIQLGEATQGTLTHVALYEETLCAVVSRAHPLATVATVDVVALQDMDWIVPTRESAAMRSAQAFFDAAKLDTPRRIVESVSVLTNLGLLMESQMVALMPRTVAEHFVRSGLLSILPLDVQSSFGQVGYTLCADRPPSAATQRLISALREVAGAV
jgi:DNA-binding transcriptional LysR family regulator